MYIEIFVYSTTDKPKMSKLASHVDGYHWITSARIRVFTDECLVCITIENTSVLSEKIDSIPTVAELALSGFPLLAKRLVTQFTSRSLHKRYQYKKI